MPLDVVPDKLERGFVCTWCGDSFATRAQLDAHWSGSDACGRNRNAVSGQVPREREFGVPLIQAGEHTLRRVRAHEQDDDDPRRA